MVHTGFLCNEQLIYYTVYGDKCVFVSKWTVNCFAVIFHRFCPTTPHLFQLVVLVKSLFKNEGSCSTLLGHPDGIRDDHTFVDRCLGKVNKLTLDVLTFRTNSQYTSSTRLFTCWTDNYLGQPRRRKTSSYSLNSWWAGIEDYLRTVFNFHSLPLYRQIVYTS